jgi:hypothetical protein
MGAGDGVVVGASVGARVGSSVGSFVGSVVGSSVDISVGSSVNSSVGSTVGSSVVGAIVGNRVGWTPEELPHFTPDGGGNLLQLSTTELVPTSLPPFPVCRAALLVWVTTDTETSNVCNCGTSATI